MKHKVNFKNGASLEIENNTNLCEEADILNSPIFFGCRTGVCATCIVKVHTGMKNLPSISEDEKEVLELYTEIPHCRLACKLNILGDIDLEYIGK